MHITRICIGVDHVWNLVHSTPICDGSILRFKLWLDNDNEGWRPRSLEYDYLGMFVAGLGSGVLSSGCIELGFEDKEKGCLDSWR